MVDVGPPSFKTSAGIPPGTVASFLSFLMALWTSFRVGGSSLSSLMGHCDIWLAISGSAELSSFKYSWHRPALMELLSFKRVYPAFECRRFKQGHWQPLCQKNSCHLKQPVSGVPKPLLFTSCSWLPFSASECQIWPWSMPTLWPHKLGNFSTLKRISIFWR